MPRQKKLNTPEKRARVGERIKVAATQAGLTLKELAESTGTSPSLIYQYVRGITSIPPDRLERIAAVTQVHTDFFDPDKDARTALALPADTPVPEGETALRTGGEPATRARIQAELRHLHELAQAQDYPKRNRAAYVSSLERMLALARMLEDRRQEAWILWRLGRARLEDNLLDEAKQLILAARDLFAAENLEDYRFHATQDLVIVLSEQGAFEAAQSYLEEALQSAVRDVRWRALITLGSLRYRQHDYEGALRCFSQAAEQIEQFSPEQREQEAMPHLLSHLADVVRSTGHYEEAMMLWSRCLQQATVDRKADAFIESLMEIAQCCQVMGRISEARERLELAVVYASFLFEDEARLSVARALLADVLVAMGSLEEAKDNAHAALRLASRVGGARSNILASLALAETCLAAGQWNDALRYTQDALTEAKRTGRTREVAQAHEMRARAYLRQHEECRASGDVPHAQEALALASHEAGTALERAIRAESVRERITAHLTLARCYLYQGDEAGAEREAHEALKLTQEGGVGLNRLLGKEVENLPGLLRSPELDLPGLFAGRKLNLPVLEWQAHYLEGTLLAKRLGPDAAFEAMRDAARAVSRVLSGLTQAQASAFQRQHPEITAVFDDLKRFALTDDAQQETTRLLESARWAGVGSNLPALAAPAVD